ncbi:early protein E4 [Alouatta guariba papillomavirus 1]|uniref:Early protein E4 n=1 Tax=Alouatta guariba papillomavirus 1 TaxID=1784959 RepID=A0A140CC00_9PAPI|nr:early protein E4 [Alouatta guariba papillomavirus 1]
MCLAPPARTRYPLLDLLTSPPGHPARHPTHIPEPPPPCSAQRPPAPPQRPSGPGGQDQHARSAPAPFQEPLPTPPPSPSTVWTPPTPSSPDPCPSLPSGASAEGYIEVDAATARGTRVTITGQTVIIKLHL